MIKTGLSLLLIFSFFTLQTNFAFAQTKLTKEEKKTLKVKEKIKQLGVGEKTIVKVKLYSGSNYQGYVSEANEDSFVVVSNGKSNTFKYSEVDSIGGKNLSTGTKIGIGIGVGVGVGILVALLIVRYGIND